MVGGALLLTHVCLTNAGTTVSGSSLGTGYFAAFVPPALGRRGGGGAEVQKVGSNAPHAGSHALVFEVWRVAATRFWCTGSTHEVWCSVLRHAAGHGFSGAGPPISKSIGGGGQRKGVSEADRSRCGSTLSAVRV